MENKELTLNEYQRRAMTTCLPSCKNDMYMLLGLVEEVGELCGKVSKAIRKGHININDNTIKRVVGYGYEIDELYESLLSEGGDCLWMLSGLFHSFGISLDDVAQYNLDKLAKRKEQGTIVTHSDH